MVQDIAIDSGDVEIGPSVIVIIDSGSPHAVPFTRHSGSSRHLRKGSIMIVVVQPIGKCRVAFVQARNAGAVGEENIEITVVVVVQQSDATQCAVDDGLIIRSAIVQDKRHAGPFLAVLEGNSRLLAGLQRSQQGSAKSTS